MNWGSNQFWRIMLPITSCNERDYCDIVLQHHNFCNASLYEKTNIFDYLINQWAAISYRSKCISPITILVTTYFKEHIRSLTKCTSSGSNRIEFYKIWYFIWSVLSKINNDKYVLSISIWGFLKPHLNYSLSDQTFWDIMLDKSMKSYILYN